MTEVFYEGLKVGMHR